jgi:hypothetical protein
VPGTGGREGESEEMGRHLSHDEFKDKKKGERRRAAIVVLGDIGRCPRMQYHALSLSKQV